MHTLRAVAVAASVALALALQGALAALLPGPAGAAPDLVLMVVVAIALVDGRLAGLLTGFATGLAADLAGSHPLGQLALVYCLTGHLVGCAAQRVGHSVVARLGLALAAAAAAPTAYAALGALAGDPRATWSALLGYLPGALLYAVVLFPVVVPAVRAGSRRLGAGGLSR